MSNDESFVADMNKRMSNYHKNSNSLKKFSLKKLIVNPKNNNESSLYQTILKSNSVYNNAYKEPLNAEYKPYQTRMDKNTFYKADRLQNNQIKQNHPFLQYYHQYPQYYNHALRHYQWYPQYYKQHPSHYHNLRYIQPLPQQYYPQYIQPAVDNKKKFPTLHEKCLEYGYKKDKIISPRIHNNTYRKRNPTLDEICLDNGYLKNFAKTKTKTKTNSKITRVLTLGGTKPQKAKPQKAKPQKAKPQKAKPQKAKPQKAKPQKAKPQKAKYT
jgi:hypothetical protein